MSDRKTKFGILIIVIILGITGILIVKKSVVSEQQEQIVSPGDSPAEIASVEQLASSSDLSSPIPLPYSIEEYVYPNSRTVKTLSKGLVLESTDSVQLITDWYKSRINALDFNAKSFTQSNTNNETLSKISAARPGENLEVTIKKDQTTSKVEITVDRS